mgnify:CR=1 FL=1
MSRFTIRRAQLPDVAVLAELAAETFADTFAKDNTAEDLDAHLKSAYGIPQQTAEIQDADVVTLLAFDAEHLVGFAQVRRKHAPSCVHAERPIEIHRLYLKKCVHGTGLASELMRHAFEAAMQLDATHLWLGVWERNPRALAFYRKAGFVEVGSHVFLVGSDRQRDLVLVAPLRSASSSAA